MNRCFKKLLLRSSAHDDIDNPYHESAIALPPVRLEQIYASPVPLAPPALHAYTNANGSIQGPGVMKDASAATPHDLIAAAGGAREEWLALLSGDAEGIAVALGAHVSQVTGLALRRCGDAFQHPCVVDCLPDYPWTLRVSSATFDFVVSDGACGSWYLQSDHGVVSACVDCPVVVDDAMHSIGLFEALAVATSVRLTFYRYSGARASHDSLALVKDAPPSPMLMRSPVRKRVRGASDLIAAQPVRTLFIPPRELLIDKKGAGVFKTYVFELTESTVIIQGGSDAGEWNWILQPADGGFVNKPVELCQGAYAICRFTGLQPRAYCIGITCEPGKKIHVYGGTLTLCD